MDKDMEEIVKTFNEDGICLVKEFASKDECKGMIDKMKEIINKTNMKEKVLIQFPFYCPDINLDRKFFQENLEFKEHTGQTFECQEKDPSTRNEYFMKSGRAHRIKFYNRKQPWTSSLVKRSIVPVSLKSADKIHFFFDPNAFDKDGNLIDGKQTLEFPRLHLVPTLRSFQNHIKH